MAMQHYAVKIDAGNCRNGNPRRGWFVYDSLGFLVEFIDRGYSGSKPMRDKYPGIVELCSLRVPASEYRQALKLERLG